jgi:arylsulfatase A-like enzyme
LENRAWDRGDAILEADWAVGEVLKKLEATGMDKNTLILFSSDNGPVLNDGYHDEAVEKLGKHDPFAGLRGGKYSLFEGGAKVPSSPIGKALFNQKCRMLWFVNLIF